jgi:ankyrin repeat protein
LLTEYFRFRWIACQLDTLRRYFRGTIRHALDELPKTLDETYERMLLAIDEEKSEYAIRIFQCMAVSRRPLRVKELAEVIPVQLDAGGIPRLHVGQRQRDAEEAVLSPCSSLVTIIKPTTPLYNSDFRAVQFSHCSVKKFLTSERLFKSKSGLSRYHISPEAAHTILAQCCVSTLLQLNHHTDRDSIHDFPLANYAVQNWVFHAQFDGVASKIQGAMDYLFDAEGPYFAAWVWLHDIDDPLRGPLVSRLPERPKASPLYYSVLCGFRDLVGRLATACKRDINTRGGNHGTPLLAAVDRGHLEIVQLLLELGADVNAYHEGESALHKALRSRRFDIMMLLLTFKADVTSRDKQGVFPLLRALESGDFGIMQILLHYGAKADTRDDCGYTLLHHASQTGNIELAKLLLGFRADVNFRDDCDSTPLHEASRFGNPNIARLLLDNGADVNARDNKGCSPLHKAIRLDVDVVQLLLQYGADVHVQDNDGSTPLHRAAQDGNPEMVLVLLEHNATYVDARDAKDSTPLHLASEQGHLDVARLLFELGADVDAVNDEAQTPSSIASARGHRELARFLHDISL